MSTSVFPEDNAGQNDNQAGPPKGFWAGCRWFAGWLLRVLQVIREMLPAVVQLCIIAVIVLVIGICIFQPHVIPTLLLLLELVVELFTAVYG